MGCGQGGGEGVGYKEVVECWVVSVLSCVCVGKEIKCEKTRERRGGLGVRDDFV